MVRHPHDLRHSSPAVLRARERAAGGGGDSGRVVKDASGTRVDLDVKVEDLGDDGVDIHESLPSSFVTELLDDGREPRWTAHDDARLDVHLEREASFVRIKGRAGFRLKHPCVRCLTDVPFDVELDLDLRLVEKTGAAPVDAEYSEGDAGDGDDVAGAPLGDASDLEDLDIASYQGDTVKVGELLREQLFLELPMHPACDSPRARPEKPCAFDAKSANEPANESWRESRWSGLASLRDKLPPGPGADKKTQEKPMTTTNKLDPAKAARIYGDAGGDGEKHPAQPGGPEKQTVKVDRATMESYATETAPQSGEAKKTRKLPQVPDEEIEDEDIVEATTVPDAPAHPTIALPGRDTPKPASYRAETQPATPSAKAKPASAPAKKAKPAAKKKPAKKAKKAKPAAKKATKKAKSAKKAPKKAAKKKSAKKRK